MSLSIPPTVSAPGHSKLFSEFKDLARWHDGTNHVMPSTFGCSYCPTNKGFQAPFWGRIYERPRHEYASPNLNGWFGDLYGEPVPMQHIGSAPQPAFASKWPPHHPYSRTPFPPKRC